MAAVPEKPCALFFAHYLPGFPAADLASSKRGNRKLWVVMAREIITPGTFSAVLLIVLNLIVTFTCWFTTSIREFCSNFLPDAKIQWNMSARAQ
jgi:hypothetical protein